MSAKETIFKRNITYKGIMDFKKVMGGVKSLLSDLGYSVDENTHEFTDEGGVHSHMIEWDVYKKPDKYVKFSWFVKFVTSDLKPVKVVDDKGVEVLRREGNISILIKADLETDYLNRWDTNPYTRFLKGFFDKYVYGRGHSPDVSKGLYKKWINTIDNEANMVFKEAKALLNLYSSR